MFVRGLSYSPQQRNFAIAEIRRQYLDQEPSIACLLIESEDSLIAWHEDRHMEVNTEPDLVLDIDLIDLIDLIEKMRSPQGIKIQNRSQSFRLPHLRCFLGKEAVDWMCKNLAIDREQAVKLGERLIVAKLMTNLSNTKSLEDGDFHYQFFADK